MSTSKPKSDANQTAARVVAESTAHTADSLPADLEAAWKAWSAGVGKVDSRAMSLLRAAFEAGAEAARGHTPTNGTAADLGRRGGLKGGKARAAALSPDKRKAIAQKAAATRWGQSES